MRTSISHSGIWISIPIIFFIAGFVFRFMIIGHDYIGYVLFLLAILFIVFHFLNKHRCTRIRLVLTILIIAGLVVFGVIEVPIIRASRTDKDASCSYVVVLGAGVNGSTPSLSLVNRLDAALEYLKENPDSVAIVSGGQGRNEDITEAEAMSIWLKNRGISSDRIIKEDKAESTVENLKYSFDIMKKRGYDPADGVAIVSSEYHLYRAKLIADSLGAKPYGIAGKTTWPLMKINYFIREGLGAIYMKVFGI